MFIRFGCQASPTWSSEISAPPILPFTQLLIDKFVQNAVVVGASSLYIRMNHMNIQFQITSGNVPLSRKKPCYYKGNCICREHQEVASGQLRNWQSSTLHLPCQQLMCNIQEAFICQGKAIDKPEILGPLCIEPACWCD